eukprot:6462563-Amphidinium_carterae.5
MVKMTVVPHDDKGAKCMKYSRPKRGVLQGELDNEVDVDNEAVVAGGDLNYAVSVLGRDHGSFMSYRTATGTG